MCHTSYSLVICFVPSLADLIIFLTLTRLVVEINFVNFSFALFTPPPSRRLSTRPCAPTEDSLQRDPWRFKQLAKGSRHYLYVSLTFTGNPFYLCFFAVPSPRRRTAENQAPANLYRPDNSTTSVPVRLTSNSTSTDPFPSINCRVLSLNRSVHGDRAINGQSNAFSRILWVLV
jgi:hypothetical protein